MLGYARLSTGEQTTEGQVTTLRDAGCVRVWTETASGALDRRPQLDQVLDHLRPGDTLVVVRLDRLGRSLRHLIDVATGLAERGVHFRSLSEGFDTSTAGGRMIFQVLGTLADFERSIIRERSVAALDVARARGRKGGRRPKMNPTKLARHRPPALRRPRAHRRPDRRHHWRQPLHRPPGARRANSHHCSVNTVEVGVRLAFAPAGPVELEPFSCVRFPVLSTTSAVYRLELNGPGGRWLHGEMGKMRRGRNDLSIDDYSGN